MSRSRRRLVAQSHLPAQGLSGRNLPGRPACGLGRRGVRMDISGEVGFMLPLAVLMTMVLLLGSLSVQGIVLQRHMIDSTLLKSRAKDDALSSSAQVVAGELQLSGSCLIKEDYNKWEKNNNESKDKSCPGDFLPYRTGSVSGGTYEVVDYQYSQNDADTRSSMADLTISWRPGSGSLPTQKTFTISIDSSVDPPKLLGVTP